MNKQVGGAVAISAANALNLKFLSVLRPVYYRNFKFKAALDRQLKRAAWRAAAAIVACVIGALAGVSPGVAQDAAWLAAPIVAGPVASSFDFDAGAN
jgi:hypothetical protein